MSLSVFHRATKSVTENYDIISWVLCIFLGGTINIGVLNAFYSYVTALSLPAKTILISEIILGGLIVIAITLPLILSLILTAIQPEFRIIPPFFITIISWVWLFVLWVNQSNASTMIPLTFFIGTFYVTMGYFEDWGTTKILGKAIERENIYFEHLLVYAEINDVKNRLITPEIRRTLHISETVEGKSADCYLLKTRNVFTFKNDIILAKNKESPELTDLKIVYYEVERYSLRVSKDFVEDAHMISGYVRDVFTNHVPNIGVEVVASFGNTVNDPSIDRVIDDMRGFYARSKQFSNADRFKIGLLTIVLILTGILFIIGQPTYAVLSIAIEVLIAVLGLPDIIRRQRE